LLLTSSILVLVAAGSRVVDAQTPLPEIVVRSPSPIVRRSPPQPTPVAAPVTAPDPSPASAALFPGTLPIVTDQFATVTVVPSAEIESIGTAQLGDLLFNKPGITGSTFAPGASRPIVRGLDNYRVRIQENGLGVNDVSDLSEDHGVPIDPLSAQRIEVIRGPATLRWGSQAIGGVVDVTNNRIPDAIPQRGFNAEVRGAATTVDNGNEGAVLLDAGAGNVAFHADAYTRRASDYRIPQYPYLFPPDPAPIVNGRQPNSGLHSQGQSVGGSFVFDGGYAGVAISHFTSLYGIPGIEAAESNTRIDMEQTKITSKGEFRPQSSIIDAVRYWAGASNYRHDEIANEGGFHGVQQSFFNKGQEGRVEVQLAPFDLRFAALTTALGVQAARQELTSPGLAGGLFDPNDITSVAGFMFNEFRFTETLRMQVAGRIEHVTANGASPDFPADFTPDGSDLVSTPRSADFTPKSAAIGFLKDLPGGLVASLTAQYVERAPRTPELYSRGPHEATATFEIGNPNLTIEAAKTVEVGLRRAQGPFRFEATAYYTQFSGFIFKRLTGLQCGEDFASCGVEDELNQIVYSQRDATFRGGEIQTQVDLTPLWNGIFGVEGQYDIVRATFTDGTNVPRIPPQRVGGGFFWRDTNWLARVGLLHAFAQTQIAENETPTQGYDLLRAELSYTKRIKPNAFGPHEFTAGIVGTNLLDDDVRNSASFKKDEVLLPGRGVRFFANVRF
jgi:iron complex outermembrane recepter protein